MNSVILSAEVLSGTPLSTSVIHFAQNVCTQYKIHLYTSDISVYYLKRKFLDTVESQRTLYNGSSVRLSTLLNQNIPGLEINEEDIYAHVDSILNTYAIEVLKTQQQTLNALELVFSGIRNSNQKFMDTVSLEVLLQYIPKLIKQGKVAYISHDPLFRQYLISQTMNYHAFSVYPSISDLESNIRLLHELGELQHIRTIEDDVKHMWLRELIFTKHVKDMIIRTYADVLFHENQKEDEKQIGSFYTTSPVFIEKQQKALIFMSTVLYRQLHIGYTSMSETMSEFSVRWWVQLTHSQKIEHADIIDSRHISTYQHEQSSTSGSIPLLLTQSGQPLIQVS